MKQIALLFFLIPFFYEAEQAKTVSIEHYQKGLEYYKANDSEKAKSEFLKALETNNADDASKNMLVALEREVYKEEPGDSFKDLVKELFLKGLVFYRAGEKEKALREWEKGLSLTPNNKQLKEFCNLVNEASKENSLKPVEKKEAERKKTVKKEVPVKKTALQKEKHSAANAKKSVDEKKVSDLYYEGLKLYKQGDLKKAVEIWEQVLKLDPDSNKTRKNLDRAKKELTQGE